MTMKTFRNFLVLAGIVAFASVSCSSGEHDEAEAEGEHSTAMASAESEEHEGGAEGSGEHARREGDEHGEGGDDHGVGEDEESGVYIAKTERWDGVRNGARLRLAYNPHGEVFTGSVLNTTSETLCRVRVEVHLAGGMELGPTRPVDLPAGEAVDVELAVLEGEFETWTAHPEVTACPEGDD